jgi:tetratricopeptide (TPR) repeat protein
MLPHAQGNRGHVLARASLGILSSLSVLLLASCAARLHQPSPQTIAAELGKAQALVNDGCYRCLQEALTTYEQLLIYPNAPADAVAGAFRASLLLALRSKELGLPDELPTQTARAHATKAAALPTSSVEAAPPVLLDAFALVSGETSGLAPEERERRMRERRALWPPRDGALPAARVALESTAATDMVAQYLLLAVDCENAQLRKAIRHEPILARYPQPIMRFRVALCGIPNLLVDPLRQADPRWVDTLYYEGRHEMTKFPAPDIGRAAQLLDLAHAEFPASTAMTLTLGNARNALEEHAVALALFDSILQTEPTHRDALLGRLLSLSYMKRHYDAIRTASQMIDLGTYHMGDAYYWRAWNRYQVHELPSAWTDVEAASKLMVNTAVFTLAGFIAYAQRDLDTAVDRLDRAYRLDHTNCEAVWTEGMVRVDKEEWTDAAARFGTAMTCFADDAAAARGEIQAVQTSSWADAVKTRKVATAQKRAATSEHRHAQSAFNAASSYLRLGKKTEALAYADTAAHHPLLAEKASALRATIAKLP